MQIILLLILNKIGIINIKDRTFLYLMKYGRRLFGQKIKKIKLVGTLHH